jgi:hypothetical protein
MCRARRKLEIAHEKRVKSLAASVYAARKARREHPEGTFDKAQRFYPSDREDGGGDGTSVRSPSRSWPFSYMLRCRTRQHCVVLVERALEGFDVPPDVARVVGPIDAIDRLAALAPPTSPEVAEMRVA